MKFKAFIISFVFVFCTGMVSAGGWSKITRADFDKAMDNVETFFSTHQKYSFTVVHTSYKGYDASDAFDKMKGYFHRDGYNYHSMLVGIQTIQNNQIRVIVDTLNKSVMVTAPVVWKKTEVMMINYETASSFVTSYKMMSTVNGTLYRVEFNDSLPRYTAYEVEVGKDNAIKTIVMYFKSSYKVDQAHPNAPLAHPKVRIDFEDYNEKAAFGKNEFDPSRYVTEQGGKYVLSSAYKGYRLTDGRFIKPVDGNTKTKKVPK